MGERVAFVEGELEIETAPGAGTIVRVTLPAARVPASEQVPTAETG